MSEKAQWAAGALLGALTIAAIMYFSAHGVDERRELAKTNSAQPAQEIDMAEEKIFTNLARTVGPTIGAKIHPDDATIGAMAMAHWSRMVVAEGSSGPGHCDETTVALEFIAEAKRQREAAEVKP